jgi:hypothetical protein
MKMATQHYQRLCRTLKKIAIECPDEATRELARSAFECPDEATPELARSTFVDPKTLAEVRALEAYRLRSGGLLLREVGKHFNVSSACAYQMIVRGGQLAGDSECQLTAADLKAIRDAKLASAALNIRRGRPRGRLRPSGRATTLCD